MPNRTNIPVIFLACANSYKAGRRLPYLVKERRRIANILSLEEEKGHVQVIQEGNTSKDFFFDELRQRRYKNRIAIIHFAGHADGSTLRFESEEGQEEVMDVSTLSNFLKTIKGLHLVFLNGCGTQPIVENLLSNGIPVVIATETKVEDEQAARVAEEFYQGIAGGYSIEESFTQAKAIARSAFGFHKLNEGDLSRGMFFKDFQESLEEKPSFPWGLYTLAGAEEHLEWHLETQTKPEKKDRPWILRLEGILTVLGLLITIIFGILELRDNSKSQAPELPSDSTTVIISDPGNGSISLRDRIDRIENNPKFFGAGRQQSYNVLFLPFQKLSLPVSTVEGYVKSRLRGLAGTSNLPLNIKIRDLNLDLNLEEEVLNIQDARAIGRKFGADMIVWGKYFYGNNSPNEIKLDVSSGSGVNRFSERALLEIIQERQEDRPLPTYPYPDFIKYTNITQDLEDAVLFARGNEKIQDESFEEAVNYLENVQGSYVPVHLQFAKCFENLAEISPSSKKAGYFMRLVSRLDSVSQLAPDIKNAQYAYYQGILYDLYGTGVYKGTVKARAKAAQEAYTQAIQLDEAFVKAYFRRGRLYQYKLSTYFKNKADVYYDSALLDYNAYIARNPDFAYVYHDKGRLYHYHLIRRVPGAVDSALASYSRAIELEPEFVYAYEDRGRLYQTYLEDDKLAQADFDQAIRFGGTSYSYFYRGLLHQDHNDPQEALKDYSMALEMNNRLSQDPFFKKNIYENQLVSQPLPDGVQSVYTQLAKIYEKNPKDSLLFYKNALIILDREGKSKEKLDESLKRKAIKKLRVSGRMSKQ